MTSEWKDITNPEELFKLKREGWEIDIYASLGWGTWNGTMWQEDLKFRARPPQPKVKRVKMLCYLFNNRYLAWYKEDEMLHTQLWIRQPKLDLEAEFEE